MSTPGHGVWSTAFMPQMCSSTNEISQQDMQSHHTYLGVEKEHLFEMQGAA
jgi:hypothetical protein